jgi:hypothetical protein
MQNVGTNNVFAYLPIRLELAIRIFLHAFFIKKGYSKLCVVDFDEFNLLSLPTNIIMRFCLGNSKNWGIDVTCCFVDWHRLAIDYLVSDVIET